MSHSPPPARYPESGLIGLYEKVMRFLAGSSMALITVIMLVQVAARYIFNSSLIWAEELCRYILIWQTFLFISMAFRAGELVAVDILTNMMPPKVLYILRLLVAVPIALFLALMVKYGIDFASRFSRQTIPAIDFIWNALTGRNAGLTVIWVYISVSIGSALLLFHFVISLLVDGRALFFPHRDTHSAA